MTPGEIVKQLILTPEYLTDPVLKAYIVGWSVHPNGESADEFLIRLVRSLVQDRHRVLDRLTQQLQQCTCHPKGGYHPDEKISGALGFGVD